MKMKFASFVALLLVVTFLSVGVSYAVEKEQQKAQATMEQATQKASETKAEMKGTVEEEKGKVVTEMKEATPEGKSEEVAKPTAPEMQK